MLRVDKFKIKLGSNYGDHTLGDILSKCLAKTYSFSTKEGTETSWFSLIPIRGKIVVAGRIPSLGKIFIR